MVRYQDGGEREERPLATTIANLGFPLLSVNMRKTRSQSLAHYNDAGLHL